MFRFSLRKLLFVFIATAGCLAFVGLMINQLGLVQTLFDSGDKRVVIQYSHVNPQGTFFELYRGTKRVISKTEISHHPIKASEIAAYEFDPENAWMAYYYHNESPEVLDVLLIVDFDSDAYATYWAGCRADKCKKLDWNTWDQRSKKFHEFLSDLNSSPTR
jgi:hypothetical protein